MSIIRNLKYAALLCLVALSHTAKAEPATVHDLLGQAPAGTVGVFVAPMLQDFLDQANTLGKTPGVATLLDEEAATLAASGEPLADLIEVTTGTTLGDVLSAAGVTGDRPAALYFGPDLEPAAFVLPVEDGGTTLEAVGKTISGGVESETIGEQEVWYSAGELVGFFERDDSLVFGLTRDGLERLAEKKTREVEWFYSTDAFPAQNEFALVIDPASIAKQPMLQEDKNTAAIVDALAAQFNEFVAGLHFGEDAAHLRFAAHDTTPAEAPTLEPLALHSRAPKDSLAVAVLRLSQGLKEFLLSSIKTATNNNPQVSNFGKMAMEMLGPEISVAITGAMPDGSPEYLGIVPLTESPQAVVLLTIAGLGGAPEEEHGGVPIQLGDGLSEGLGIYLANISNTLVLSNNVDNVKKYIDKEGGAFSVPDDVRERGNHGFIYVPDKRGLELLAQLLDKPLPEGLADDVGATTLTLEAHTGWRQMALKAPNAETLAALMATE